MSSELSSTRLEVDALHRRSPLDLGPLEGVVHGLGDGEELVAAVHDLPVGVEADAAQERDVGGQELGDTSAVRRGVEVEDPLSGQWAGELADPLDGVGSDDVGVVVELLLEQRDAVQHRAPSCSFALDPVPPGQSIHRADRPRDFRQVPRNPHGHGGDDRNGGRPAHRGIRRGPHAAAG